MGRKAKLAVGICFEVAYDNELRAGVHQGGQAYIFPLIMLLLWALMSRANSCIWAACRQLFMDEP